MPQTSLPPADLAEIRTALGGAWEGLAGARILLTGCSGFFGPWLVEPLLEARDRLGLELEAWVLTRDPGAFRAHFPGAAAHPFLHLLQGDVRTWQDPGLHFTHLLHGAASSNPVRDPADPAAAIVDGTARMLAAAGGWELRRALFISSGAVYGPIDGPVPEDHPAEPATPYGRAKLQAEALCAGAWAGQGVPVTSARCFAFLAPHLPLDAHFAAGNFLRDALAGRDIQVQGDGRPVRSYLYGTDLAIWLWTLLLRGEPGRAYNVGSDQAVTIGELAREVAELAGVGVATALPPGPGPAPFYVPDIRRVGDELGLRPRVALREALRRTLAWHRSREVPDARR